jgi:hypothetical protein
VFIVRYVSSLLPFANGVKLQHDDDDDDVDDFEEYYVIGE